jgi:uncharacterized membrane protein
MTTWTAYNLGGALSGGSDPFWGATDATDVGTICGESGELGVLVGPAVIWKNSLTYTALDLLPGHEYAKATAINASGVVCGFGFDAADTSYFGGPARHAYRWTGTAATDLPPVGGHVAALAYGINDSGQVVGASFSAAGGNRAVIWNGTTPTVLDNLPAETTAQAWDINNASQRVGISGSALHAVSWLNTTAITDLGTYSALAVNNSGVVVGYHTVSGQLYASYWSDITSAGSVTLLPSGGFTPRAAYGIADSGVVVGTDNNVALVWEDVASTPQALPALPGAMFADRSAFGVNPAGTLITGWGYDDVGVAVCVLWASVPWPFSEGRRRHYPDDVYPGRIDR